MEVYKRSRCCSCFTVFALFLSVMVVSESLQIREALNILSNASGDELKPYWPEARAIMQRLKRQMRIHSTKKPPLVEICRLTVTSKGNPSSAIKSERPCHNTTSSN